MSTARLLGLIVGLVYLVSFLGLAAMLWWERRRPSSYTRSPEYLAELGEPPLEVWARAAAAREAGLRVDDVARRCVRPDGP